MRIDVNLIHTKPVGSLIVGQSFVFGNTLYLKAQIDSIFLTNSKADGVAVVNLQTNSVKVWAKEIQVTPIALKIVKDTK